MLYIFRHAQENGVRLALLDEPHIDTAKHIYIETLTDEWNALQTEAFMISLV